jgi:hypothetical protein
MCESNLKETKMKKSLLLLSALLASLGMGVVTQAQAQAKEQFVPVLSYRTGPYAPNGTPWANGFVDYLKLVNAKGGINGVKIAYEECETGYDTARSVECYERLKCRTPALCKHCLPVRLSPSLKKPPATKSRCSPLATAAAKARTVRCSSGTSLSLVLTG